MHSEGLGPEISNGARPSLSQPIFEAILAPHQSLGRRGSFILMAGLGVLSAGISLRFLILGAWPVMAFSCIEVMLAVLLLAVHRRRAQMREVIRLNASEIMVVQTEPGGKCRSFSLPSAWLQVRLEGASGSGSRLVLRTHGSGREVGSFLHDPDRLSLFEALQDALHRLRHPRFENEQTSDR